MIFADEQIAQLDAPLDGASVKTREQAGRKVSYIEGWHVIAEANRIFGFGGWGRETTELRAVSERPRKIGRPPNERDGWSVSYIAKVRLTVGEVVRDGVGSGHGIDVDLGLAHESAAKEAETDSTKRAFMTFGNQFGLALYDKSQENVAWKPDGPSMTERGEAVEKALALVKTPDELKRLWRTLAPDMKVVFRGRVAKLGEELLAGAEQPLRQGSITITSGPLPDIPF